MQDNIAHVFAGWTPVITATGVVWYPSWRDVKELDRTRRVMADRTGR